MWNMPLFGDCNNIAMNDDRMIAAGSYCNVAVIVMLLSLQPYSIGSVVHYCINIIQV